jgi:hypothetical protein
VAAARNGLRESRPGTWILDLQVIRPDPYVEQEGEVVEPIEGEPLFEADAASRSERPQCPHLFDPCRRGDELS